MEQITTSAQLHTAIQLLKIEQQNKGVLLKEQAKITYESLKIANLIKHTLNEIVSAPDLKENALATTLSLAAGYLSKIAMIGTTINPIKQLLGTLLQMGVTSVLANNKEEIMSALKTGLTLLKTNFLTKQNDTPNAQPSK
ncbi:MAG: hypothetical protein H7331_07665 [Bacteroidia bacterium]|nr:hypothetical protein [Bacteroidia bacterium]